MSVECTQANPARLPQWSHTNFLSTTLAVLPALRCQSQSSLPSHLPQAKNEDTLPDSSDSDFDPDYDISRRESKRSRSRPSQAKERNTPRPYLGPLSLRQSPDPSQQATPAGSGGSFHVQIASPTSDNNVVTPRAVLDPGECPNTDSQNGHDSCSVQQGDLGGQSSLENPDTHPATTIQEYTQEQTASKTVHAERKVD